MTSRKLLPRKQISKSQLRNRIFCVSITGILLILGGYLMAFVFVVPAANSIVHFVEKDDSINHQPTEFGYYFGSVLIIGLMTPAFVFMWACWRTGDFIEYLFIKSKIDLGLADILGDK